MHQAHQIYGHQNPSINYQTHDGQHIEEMQSSSGRSVGAAKDDGDTCITVGSTTGGGGGGGHGKLKSIDAR